MSEGVRWRRPEQREEHCLDGSPAGFRGRPWCTPQCGGGRVPRICDAPDDGGSAALLRSGASVPRKLVLEILEFQPNARGLGGLFVARHNSAGIFIFGWGGPPLFHCEPDGEREEFQEPIGARDLASAVAHSAGNFLAVDGTATDVLYV